MFQFLYISFFAVELQGEKSRAGSHRDQLQVRPKRTRSSRYLKFRKIKQMKSKSCPPSFVLKGAVFFPPDAGEVKRPTHKAHHLIENQLPSPLSGYVLTAYLRLLRRRGSEHSPLRGEVSHPLGGAIAPAPGGRWLVRCLVRCLSLRESG